MTTGTMKARNGRDCCKARKQVQFQLAVGNARLDVTLAHETTRQSTVKGSKTTTGMEAWTAVDVPGTGAPSCACCGYGAWETVHTDCGGSREDGDHPFQSSGNGIRCKG
jgi:hypothetical protein